MKARFLYGCSCIERTDVYRIRRKSFLRFCAFCIVLVLLSLFLTGCSDRAVLLVPGSNADTFPHIARRALPGFKANTSDDVPYFSGDVIFCSEVQAHSRLRAKKDMKWYPQYLATVVIAVDRDRTDARVSGWRDLEQCGAEVACLDYAGRSYMLLASISYGLDGKNYSTESALRLLRKTRQNGGLNTHDAKSPIILCTDCQAAELRRQGRNLSIVIPAEGTLSFEEGLLARDGTVPRIDEKELLAAGLRLKDGRCRGDIFPTQREYRRAARLTADDTAHLLQATRTSDSKLNRYVEGKYLNGANTQEHYLSILLFCCFVLIWTLLLLNRTLRAERRRGILLNGIMIIAWLSVRMLKYLTFGTPDISRYLWYSYYIFLMGIPLNLLCFVLLSNKPEGGKKLPRPVPPLTAVYFILLSVVFTNDVHQLVFRFDITKNWSDDYTYGPVYYVIFIYTFGLVLAMFITLVYKAKKECARVQLLPPCVLFATAAAYCAGYFAGVPILRQSDFSLVFCLISVAFIEVMFRSGLMPRNTSYTKLFADAPIGMQIADTRGNVICAAQTAAPLKPRMIRNVIGAPGRTLKLGRDKLLHANPIDGGYVLWEEDIGAMNQLKDDLKKTSEKLRAANKLLAAERTIRGREVSARVRQDILDELEAEISGQTNELAERVKKLDVTDRETMRKETAYITLLLCRIKRGCNLFFLLHSDNSMSAEELAGYLRELTEFAAYADIRSVVSSRASGPVSVRQAALCYELCFLSLKWALATDCGPVIFALDNSARRLEFSVRTDADNGCPHYPADFIAKLKKHGGKLECTYAGDIETILLSFAAGGDTNA